MTVIAVRVGKKIQIACDSQTSWGNNKLPKRSSNDKDVREYGKIFQVDGYTFGCAGHCSHVNLLQIFIKTHRPKEMTRDSVLEWFFEFKEWMQDKIKIGFNDLCMYGIIIYKKKVFSFYDHNEVLPVTSFDAVGTGMWVALGAMSLGASPEKAVEVAIKYDKYCGGKIFTIDL